MKKHGVLSILESYWGQLGSAFTVSVPYIRIVMYSVLPHVIT